MKFADIPSKKGTKDFLTRQVDEARIPHAQLFLGLEGSGSLAVALAYISYIFCEDRQNGDSCGICKSCNLSHRFIHPDFHLTFPVIKKDGLKREETTSNAFVADWRKLILENPYVNIFDWTVAMGGDSKPNINTRECNEIIQKLGMQAFSDGPKVMMIWLPEYLGKEGNRLLKLIEEPTDDTYLILVSEDQNRILPTILSRCQLVKVEMFSDEDITGMLQKKGANDKESIAEIVRLSAGNMSKALRLYNGTDQLFSDLLFAWLRAAYKGDAAETGQTVVQMTSMATDQQLQFLEYGLHFLREFVFWKTTGMTPRMSNTEIETSTKLSAILELSKIESIAEILETMIYAISRNANPKVLWMADTLAIGDILKNKVNNYVEKFNFAYQN